MLQHKSHFGGGSSLSCPLPHALQASPPHQIRHKCPTYTIQEPHRRGRPPPAACLPGSYTSRGQWQHISHVSTHLNQGESSPCATPLQHPPSLPKMHYTCLTSAPSSHHHLACVQPPPPPGRGGAGDSGVSQNLPKNGFCCGASGWPF